MALNGMKKVEIKGIYEPILSKSNCPRRSGAVTPQSLPHQNQGDKAFSCILRRETMEPRKVTKSMYIKRLNQNKEQGIQRESISQWSKIPNWANNGKS